MFLCLLIDFPSALHRICIEFASALQWRNIGGSMEEDKEENRKKIKLHTSPKAHVQPNQHNLFNYALNVLSGED